MITIDLFNSDTGITTGYTLTVSRDELGLLLVLNSTGWRFRVIDEEPCPRFWYLHRVICNGVICTVHKNDWQAAREVTR